MIWHPLAQIIRKCRMMAKWGVGARPDVPAVVKGLFTPKQIAKRFFLASTVRPFGADHRSPSKVCLRQKKSRSDFFWRRPCDRSAQTTVRHQRFFYAKKNREAIFFGVDRAAVRRRPPVDVRPSWLAQQTPSWLAQQTPSWLAQKIGPTRPADFCTRGLKVWARLTLTHDNSC